MRAQPGPRGKPQCVVNLRAWQSHAPHPAAKPKLAKDKTLAKFSSRILESLQNAKILGVRAGTEHRYTGVWLVVVEGRLFVRSWNDKPTGWFRAFKREPKGSVQVGDREIRVRGKLTRSARLREAVTKAFAEKYNTKGSQQWVKGFAEPAREINTLEFIPR